MIVLTLETSYERNMASSESCARRNLIGKFSQIGTVKVPRIELITPMPRMISGYTSHFRLWVGSRFTKDNARINAETIVTSYDSKISAAIPAQSPTLSPTRSATTAALRGSSSGISFSTLPTRSAPTSAALV